MRKVCSEDAVRRGLAKIGEAKGLAWLQNHLDYCTTPLLNEPWVLDMDSTVKTLYGHQEGAEVGYNPHKPGRPSHAYHTYMLSSLRLILKGDTRGVSARCWSPDHVPLHAQACLLDQSDRDLVLHPGSQAYPPWQLHLQRASPAEDQELHRLLQCYHRPTFPPDEKI